MQKKKNPNTQPQLSTKQLKAKEREEMELLQKAISANKKIAHEQKKAYDAMRNSVIAFSTKKEYSALFNSLESENNNVEKDAEKTTIIKNLQVDKYDALIKLYNQMYEVFKTEKSDSIIADPEYDGSVMDSDENDRYVETEDKKFTNALYKVTGIPDLLEESYTNIALLTHGARTILTGAWNNVVKEEEADVITPLLVSPQKEEVKQDHKIIGAKAVQKDTLKETEMIKSSASVNTIQQPVQFQPTSPKMSFGERKIKWGEKQKPVERTSLLARNEESKGPARLTREGSIGSMSRLGSGFAEIRDRKGSSTQRTYIDEQTGQGYTSRHDNIKEVKKRLHSSRSSSQLSHTDQLKKREASFNKKIGKSLNEKFGGMGFGGR